MDLCHDTVFHVATGLVAGMDSFGSRHGFWCRNRGNFSLRLRCVAT